MARFMDIHGDMKGITSEQLAEAHSRDKEFEGEEGVHFVKAWADPSSGKVFCLSEGPDMASVKRVHAMAGHPADEIYEVTITIE